MTTPETDDEHKRSLRLLTDKVACAVAGKVEFASYGDEVSDENYHFHPPITYPIPKEQPKYPIALQTEYEMDPDNEVLELALSVAVRKYTWDRKCWALARSIRDKFEQHKDVFLSIDNSWKTPSYKPLPPQTLTSDKGFRYNTVMELVSDIQHYLWDLQRWEEDHTTEVDTEIELSQSQGTSELPTNSDRKRGSVVTAEEHRARKAPRRKAAERRESYFANSWIPSDELQPPSSSEASNNGDNEDAETIRMGSPVGQVHNAPPSEQAPDVPPAEQISHLSPFEQMLIESPPEDQEVPMSSEKAPMDKIADLLESNIASVGNLFQFMTNSRLRELSNKISQLRKEGERKREDSELLLSHLRKYGGSISEIEWEENKKVRDAERTLKDIEEIQGEKASFEALLQQGDKEKLA